MTEVLAPKGVCFFAYNNDQLDYVKMALAAGKYVKKNLKLPVCLITDEGSESWLEESHSKAIIKEVFDYIVITNDVMKKNRRRHFDSPWTEFAAQFNNSNKHKIYEYSPFEQTLLLDIDYIVKTDTLLKYFDNERPVCMFDNASTVRNEVVADRERFLYDAGIKMWWSTVVYFDRSDFSKMFFDTWAHVAENYEFYQYLYNFPSKLFRTDYCVSIAVHILAGMQDTQVLLGNFDGTALLNMSQKDDIIKVHNANEWIMLAHDQKEVWKNILVKVQNQDIHVMNKRAFDRVLPELMEALNAN
tara:strand:- start:613 stop:1515 length:903 start_codon:yes stop_codon:yes gene_type:complete